MYENPHWYLEVGLELQLLLLVDEAPLGGVVYGAYSSASRLAVGLPAGLNTGSGLMWGPRLDRSERKEQKKSSRFKYMTSSYFR